MIARTIEGPCSVSSRGPGIKGLSVITSGGPTERTAIVPSLPTVPTIITSGIIAAIIRATVPTAPITGVIAVVTSPVSPTGITTPIPSAAGTATGTLGKKQWSRGKKDKDQQGYELFHGVTSQMERLGSQAFIF